MRSIRFSAAVCIDKGNYRSNNEDNFYFNGDYLRPDDREHSAKLSEAHDNNTCVYGVFDGMGGEAYGEEASLIAAKTTRKYAMRAVIESDKAAESLVLKAAQEANDKICDLIIERNKRRIGTTFAVLCIQNGQAKAVNIGDSRVYLYRDNKLVQISIDDTATQRLVNLGIISKEDAKTDENAHILTQHLGIFSDERIIVPHVSDAIEVKVGDKFLLCSDGLTDMLDDTDILRIVSQEKESDVLVEELIANALSAGGEDNVTALLVAAEGFGHKVALRTRRVSKKIVASSVLIFALVLGLVGYNLASSERPGLDEETDVQPVLERISFSNTNSNVPVHTSSKFYIGINGGFPKGEVRYTSSDPEIVSLNTDGCNWNEVNFVALKVGEVIITAEADGVISDPFTVTVFSDAYGEPKTDDSSSNSMPEYGQRQFAADE